MAAAVITLSNAKLIYGTQAEILALDVNSTPAVSVGDVGFAKDKLKEYTCVDNTDGASVWIVTRDSLVGASHILVGSSGGTAGTDIASPWATWQHAFDIADAGDTVYFRDGKKLCDYEKWDK